ncbi:hypothetical protein GGR90_001273 [Sphingopyxis italica]|uniref:Uncharacterized protein n=1 Tax=Sphingopyxis italica TaxID=1129133 RepID=A0A7X5XRV8_9SPHN|nr:hypothetical protein [Sphingopyxis italica]
MARLGDANGGYGVVSCPSIFVMLNLFQHPWPGLE